MSLDSRLAPRGVPAAVLLVAIVLALLPAAAAIAGPESSAAAPAEIPAPTVQGEPVGPEPTAAEPVARLAPLTPMMQEIFAAWDAHVIAVKALEARLEGVTDHREAMALQREIESARDGVELTILRIQARYARQEGRLEDAAAIEEAVATMTAPRPVAQPVERAARGGDR